MRWSARPCSTSSMSSCDPRAGLSSKRFAGLGKSAGDRTVVQVGTNSYADAAEHRRVPLDLQRDLPTVSARQPVSQLLLFGVGQWDGRGHVGALAVPPGGGQLDEAGQRRVEPAPAEA